MTEQPADNGFLNKLAVHFEPVSRQQIRNDVIIIPRVERNFIASAGMAYGPRHVKRLIAVEWSHLDSNNPGNLRKAAPELIAEDSASHRRLQIKADNRHSLRY
ncbi:hypothetical protein D3C71_1988250 [compost metagenome]